ncbi:thiamine phosphate synthase [Helicobacter didelphidarum]|nr:thiamine phosphate synthase [Helicobacter didelphidarum]
MFCSYLIVSDTYYEDSQADMSNHLMYSLKQVYRHTHNILHIDFACFRYHNTALLNFNETKALLSFLQICYKYGTTPIINLSCYKIEIFYALLMRGFSLGIHFKESDICFLESNICKKIRHEINVVWNFLTQNNHAMIKDSLLQKENIMCNYKIFYEYYTMLCNMDIFNEKYNKQIYPLNNISLKQSFKQGKIPLFYSAHSLNDLYQAFSVGIDYATISPIYYDKGNKALGIDFIESLPPSLKHKTFGLGGVNNKKRIEEIQKSGLKGFASISFFAQFLEKE